MHFKQLDRLHREYAFLRVGDYTAIRAGNRGHVWQKVDHHHRLIHLNSCDTGHPTRTHCAHFVLVHADDGFRNVV